MAKRAEVERALRSLDLGNAAEPRSLPAISRQLGSIVEDWDQMDAGQRRRVLDTLFDEFVVDDGHLRAATPKAG